MAESYHRSWRAWRSRLKVMGLASQPNPTPHQRFTPRSPASQAPLWRIRRAKEAIRDWKQNLDRKASAEFSSRGTAALQTAMESQVRLELERLKECLAKIK